MASPLDKLNGTRLYPNLVSRDQGRWPLETPPPHTDGLCSQLPVASLRNTRHPSVTYGALPPSPTPTFTRLDRAAALQSGE